MRENATPAKCLQGRRKRRSLFPLHIHKHNHNPPSPKSDIFYDEKPVENVEKFKEKNRKTRNIMQFFTIKVGK